MKLGEFFMKIIGRGSKPAPESGYWAEKNAREAFQAARRDAINKHPSKRLILLDRNARDHAASMAFFGRKAKR